MNILYYPVKGTKWAAAVLKAMLRDFGPSFCSDVHLDTHQQTHSASWVSRRNFRAGQHQFFKALTKAKMLRQFRFFLLVCLLNRFWYTSTNYFCISQVPNVFYYIP